MCLFYAIETLMMEHNNRTRVKAPAFTIPDVRACPQYKRDNDIVPSNPKGRGAVDGNNGRKNLMNYKKYSLIGTYNVRTLRKDEKRCEFAENFKRSKISVLGLVDHKTVHEDEDVQIQHLDGSVLITTSAWRSSNGTSMGGVGFVISKSVQNYLTEIRPVTERILVAEFSGNPKTTIIGNYAPTEGSEGSQEHYETLANTINAVPKHNLTLVLGDFNAHMGTDIVPYSFHEQSNGNGRLLQELCIETDLIVTNTVLDKRPGKLWTYIFRYVWEKNPN